MRVKRPKADDLVDALKHLKIADRRSRLSLRSGRTTGSLALLVGGPSLEQTLRCRLTRSASSTSASIHPYGGIGYPCDYCCTVTGHHEMRAERADCADCPTRHLSYRGSIQLAGGVSPVPTISSDAVSSGSGFSPFTTSAGLLYSTLPTNLEFRRGRHAEQSASQHVLQSDKLRRSCGAGLSHLDFDSMICGQGAASTTQSRSSFGSTTTSNSDRHHCCCIHSGLSLLPSSNHLRLYRRLYSLIDHPCVTWYNPSRALRCLHPSIQHPGVVMGKCASQRRHSLSLRHRHSTTPGSSTGASINPRPDAPTIPDLPKGSLGLSDTAQSDLTPVNCDRRVPDFPPTSSVHTSVDLGLPCYSKPVTHNPYAFGLNSSALDRSYPINEVHNRKSYPYSEGPDTINPSGPLLFLCSQPLSFECSDLSGTDCGADNVVVTRCRRNSDPERWQLVKTIRVPGVEDGSRANQIGDHSNQAAVCSHPTVTVNPSLVTAGSGLHDPTQARSLQTNESRLLWSTESHQRNTHCRRGAGDWAYRNLNRAEDNSINFPTPYYSSGSAIHPNPPSEQFRFTPTKLCPGSRPFTFRSSVLSQPSVSSPPTVQHQLQGSASGDSVTEPLESTRKPVVHCEDLSMLWNNAPNCPIVPQSSGSLEQRVGDSVPSAPVSQSGDVDGTSLRALQQELALLENTEEINGGPNRPQITSDISVNELAAYMEHMVHIPGRMSEMAQRMYL